MRPRATQITPRDWRAVAAAFRPRRAMVASLAMALIAATPTYAAQLPNQPVHAPVPKPAAPALPANTTTSSLANAKTLTLGATSIANLANATNAKVAEGVTSSFGPNNSGAVVFAPPAQNQSFTPGIPVVGSMTITGPLDDYLQECVGFGCEDPWPSNHSISAATPAWTQGGLPAVDAPHMAAIGVATGSPTFQVNVDFDSNGSLPGSTDPQIQGVTAIRRGDVANFEAILYSCVAPQTQADNTNTQIKDQNFAARAADPHAIPQPLVSATAPVNPDCTDFANNQGNWQQVGDSSLSIGLPAPNQGSQVPLQVSDTSAFDLSTFDVTRTYSLLLRSYLQQTPGTGATIVGNNTLAEDDQYTYPFDVALVPAMAYQGKVQPFTLLYQPTGDESAPTFALSTAYGTQVQAGGTSTISNYLTDDKNRSFQAAARIGFDFQVGEPLAVNVGGGFDFGNSQFWDTSTQWGMGTTATTQDTQALEQATSVTWSHPNNVFLIPGNGRTCQVNKQGQTDPAQFQYDCTNLVNPPIDAGGERNGFEPYWYDEFILLVHPQYAVWTANGQTRNVMVGAASFVTAPVYQLDDCYNGKQAGNPCHLDYADSQVKIQNGMQWSAASETVDVTPAEAFDLLKLDPFWEASSQAAALGIQRALTTTDEPGSYGMSVENDEHHAPPDTPALATSNTADNEHTGTASVEYDMTVTDTVGSSAFTGVDLNMAGTGGKITVTNGESQTTMNQVKLIYTDSTSVRVTTTTTDGASLGDEDDVYQSEQGAACTNCHGPLPSTPRVAVYLDRVFGTFMFQDPDAPCGPFALCSHGIANVGSAKIAIDNKATTPPSAIVSQAVAGGAQNGGTSVSSSGASLAAPATNVNTVRPIQGVANHPQPGVLQVHKP